MPEQIKNKLDKVTLRKIFKGALIAGGGAVAIYILEMIPSIDFGGATAAVTGIAAIVLNIVREYRKGK